MATATPKQAFEIAYAQYQQVKNIILELSNLAKKAKVDFKFEVAMSEYDKLLQTALLYASTADGKYLPVENAFIERITDYGDVVDFLAAKYKDLSHFTWDLLPDLDIRSVKALHEILLSDLNSFADNFVEMFARIDKVIDSTDYIGDIDTLTGVILTAFSAVDGDDSDSEVAKNEVRAGTEVYRSLLSDRWKKLKK